MFSHVTCHCHHLFMFIMFMFFFKNNSLHLCDCHYLELLSTFFKFFIIISVCEHFFNVVLIIIFLIV
ncbi:MAG: hypothetical protein ACKPKO_65890, partial [Candidatus Fonsibacter sp.]